MPDSINTGVCADWTTPAAVANVGCGGADPGTVQSSITVASQILFFLSGRQYPGVCEDTVRPCARPRHPRWRDWAPQGWVQTWRHSGWGWADWIPGVSDGGCGHISTVGLGAYPIVEIVEVLVDSAVVAASAYRVVDDRWLMRVDGDGWPACQDLAADPTTDPDTFSVEFTHGTPPPDMGELAAAVLACELVKSVNGDDTCRLSRRARSITREQVTAVLLDPGSIVTDGRTGIYEVDLFLEAVNPGRSRRRAAVYTPEMIREGIFDNRPAS